MWPLSKRSQFILTKQQSRPGHIMQTKRDSQKLWPLLALFPGYRKAIAYIVCTLPHTPTLHIHTHKPIHPPHTHTHTQTHNNIYTAWLKEAMHINEAQAKKPQLVWGQRCYNSQFPFQSVSIYYPQTTPPPHRGAVQHALPHHRVINTNINTSHSHR